MGNTLKRWRFTKFIVEGGVRSRSRQEMIWVKEAADVQNYYS